MAGADLPPRWQVSSAPPTPAARARVHFVGVGGAGLSALARVALAQGWAVSGSDATESDRTRALGASGARASRRC